MKPTHHQRYMEDKVAFQIKFLHPKNWGIWLTFALLLPIIYLPLKIQFWLGKLLGLLFYKVAKSRRKVTHVNLKLAFPEKSDAEREQMAREVFINQGIGIFESLCAWFRPSVFTKHPDNISIDGLNHILKAQAQKKPVLLMGAHYTMLDLSGLLSTEFFPVGSFYRPQNNDLLEWFIFNGRRQLFAPLIGHKDLGKLSACLKNGETVWYAPDQDYGLRSGVMATFFGVPAATITAQERLIKLGDASNPPIAMMLHTYRKAELKNGRPQYHITIFPELLDYPTSDKVADAERVNRLLEQLISIAPTQWMWFHKRFKHDANGRTNYYD